MLKPRIHFRKRSADGTDQKGKGNHRHGDENAFPIEDDLHPAFVEPVPDRASAPKDFE